MGKKAKNKSKEDLNALKREKGDKKQHDANMPTK